VSRPTWALPAISAGVYQHYKGPLYLVLGYGHDSNHEGRDVVVYVGLQLDAAKPGPRLAVRTADDFHAVVHQTGDRCETPDACLANVGMKGYRSTHIPRFRYLGPSYQPPAIPHVGEDNDGFDACPEPTCPLYGKAVMVDHPHLDTPAAAKRRARAGAIARPDSAATP
jgi:hypothetical protein